MNDEEWRADALCQYTDPEAFFPEKGRSTAAAKRVCTACPVRAACLAFALERRERFGVWGGTSERERREILRRSEKTPAPHGNTDPLVDSEVARLTAAGKSRPEIALELGISTRRVERARARNRKLEAA